VEARLASRGVAVSYETNRKWIIKFGPQVAWDLRRRKLSAARPWRLEESSCRVGRNWVSVWQAVDDEGRLLDFVLQPDGDADTARRRLARLLPKSREIRPEMASNADAERPRPGAAA
jgi:transposase-like protein